MRLYPTAACLPSAAVTGEAQSNIRFVCVLVWHVIDKPSGCARTVAGINRSVWLVGGYTWPTTQSAEGSTRFPLMTCCVCLVL